MKVFDELKRRNVIKATIAYIVVAWVLLQLIDTILPIFEAPPWVFKTLTFIIAIGLPIWMIFSWVYEITPEGLKKTVKISKDQSITEVTNKRLNIIIIITLIIAIVVAFVNKPMPNTPSKTVVNNDLTLDKSIAVIPFKNLSDNRENQYFADGMMDDILNQLSIIQGLEVKSRQSSERYHESAKSIQQIGAELGANYVLEGSVQKHKDSIRIIVQLIDAINDKHLWSDKYDFEFKNVFTIQSEISKNIASELNTVISPTVIEQIDKIPTRNVEAYNLYLKGRFFWHQRTEKDLNKSIYYFKKALELDSTYALAYTGLADSYFIMSYNGWFPKDDGFNKAKEYALKTLSIDNSVAEAHATLGGILMYQEWKWKEAEKEIKLAISLNPNYATGHQYYGEYLNLMGKRNKAREHIDKALELNPNSLIILEINTWIYCGLGEFNEAINWAKKVNEIEKDRLPLDWIKYFMYLQQGNDLKIIEIIKRDTDLMNGLERDSIHLMDLYKEKGIEGIVTWRVNFQLKNNKHFGNYFAAQHFMYIDNRVLALEHLEKAFLSNEISIAGIRHEPAFKVLHNEPRFITIIKKMGLADK